MVKWNYLLIFAKSAAAKYWILDMCENCQGSLPLLSVCKVPTHLPQYNVQVHKETIRKHKLSILCLSASKVKDQEQRLTT